MLVVECPRRRRTLPPLAMRSARARELPPLIVIGVLEPAFFFGYERFLYIFDAPCDLPALALSARSRRFKLDCA